MTDTGKDHGPGLLVLIVGPSGAGKDTLIAWLRDALAGRPDVFFVRRTVTRLADEKAEDHETLTPARFAEAEAQGAFSVTWQAHGLSYGLPASLRTHLDAGGLAIANGSRRALPELRRAFENRLVVNLTVERSILRARLRARGRETEAEIEARLGRAALPAALAEDSVEIDNSGPVEVAGRATLDAIAARERATPRA